MESVTILAAKGLKLGNSGFMLLDRPDSRHVATLSVLKCCLVLSAGLSLALEQLRETAAFHSGVLQQRVTVTQETVLFCKICLDNIKLLYSRLKIPLEFRNILHDL